MPPVTNVTANIIGTERWGASIYYQIQVEHNGQTVPLAVLRRYSEFLYLHDELFPWEEFPVPKRWLGFSSAVIEERTSELQDYLNRTLNSFGEHPMPASMRLFLGLDSHPTFLARAFSGLDRDGDGQISTAEVLTAVRERTCCGKWLSCFQDLDGDGMVEADEVLTLCGRMRLCVRVGCLTGDGPALWQLMRKPFPRSGLIVPERYLEATGECFILMVCVSWLLTYLYNPAVIEKNPLKDRVGYNNICVGFDTPPARYAAMPLQVLQAFLAVRYVSLDNTRADLERKAGRIRGYQYAFTRVANACYGVFMCCFPVLLVLTPMVSVNGHTYLFFAMILLSFSVVAANFVESRDVKWPSWCWFIVFGVFTVALPSIGVLDFSNYDLPPCRGGGTDCYEWGDVEVETDYGPMTIYTTRGTEQTPPVPWQLLWVLDWGWFILLGMTVIFLPDSPPIKADFALDTEALERQHISEKDML